MAKSRRQSNEELESRLNSLEAPLSNLSENGYTRLPNGLILQWGRYPGGANSVAITWPIPFPNAVFNVSATAVGDNQTVATNNPPTLTTGYFSQLDAGSDLNSTVAFYWLAIGY